MENKPIKRVWGFFLVALVGIIVLAEVYGNFTRAEEPKEIPEVVIKAAPPRN